ncbi:hypothetical protein V8G54_008238 [Vigna mungo]|uniref:Bidirectional sugar transporter SWEET n=1 Tax=Vigna mungo TaxID=3915 RepID=A0AAQ3P4V2_VIGMU
MSYSYLVSSFLTFQSSLPSDKGTKNQRHRFTAMSHSPLSFLFGVLGNVTSFVCFLAPLPTFYRVCKKKSTEGFQSIPYVAALFSAMLWIFYAYVKTGETLLITINSFGCVIETIYLAIFITYCPKKVRMSTLRMIVLFNFGGFCTIVLLTHLLAKGAGRVKLLGWICVVFATSVFAAPLSIIVSISLQQGGYSDQKRRVPSLPSFNAPSVKRSHVAVIWIMHMHTYDTVFWFFLGQLPNVVGLTFGVIQIVLYAMYRNNKTVKDEKLPEHKGEIDNNENPAPTVSGETQEQVNTDAGDIEIAEKKEEKKEDTVAEEKRDKTYISNNNNNNEKNNNNNNEKNNKTEEKESCEV